MSLVRQRVAGEARKKANRQGVRALFSFFFSNLPVGSRAFDCLLHQTLAILVQWSHPTAGHDPDTKVCVTAVINNDVFFWQGLVKPSLRLRFD